MRLLKIIFLTLLIINSSLFALAEEASSKEVSTVADSIVRKIEISGNKRTESATILSYLEVKIGDAYNRSKEDDSIRSLYTTGFFSEIHMSFNNGILSIKVEENPIINQVDLDGNSALGSEVLLPELSLKPRSYFSKAKLQNDVNRLIEIYHKTGRFSISVKPKIAHLPQNRVDVLFEIKEGDKSKIKKILFVGNKHFSNNILKSTINSKEDKIYNILRTNHYDSDIVEYDKVLLGKFYNNHGYANFKVISAIADLVPSENGFYLTFTIEEGERFNFGKVSLQNEISSIEDGDIKKLISIKEGEIFNTKFVENSTNEIIKYLSNKGYPFVKVNADYDIDNQNKVVNIIYSISKSAKIYIGKIKISGNLKTYDYVIRREIRVAEGDPYNSFLINRSEQRIRNLDYFDKVTINTVKTSKPDVVDLDINVEEKSTADLKFSAGYSTEEGILGMITFTEKNLLGRGQHLSLQYKKTIQTFATGLSFVQPNFMGSEVDAGFSASASSENNKSSKFGKRSNSIPYNSRTYSGSLFMSYDITDYLSHYVSYSASQNDIKGVRDDAPIIIKEQAGYNLSSVVSHKLTYDKTDSQIKPTTGYLIALSQSFAGLGGNARYLRHILDGNYYYPVTEDIVLKLSGSLGHTHGIGKAVRISDNFFLGDHSFRGFEYAGIGPRDKKSLDALGGTLYYKGTMEVIFAMPFVPRDLDISGAVFSDFGNLMNVDIAKKSQYSKADFYNSHNIRASAGVGLIWSTNMGPLRLDYAVPFKKDKFDEVRNFLFSFSTMY